MAKGTKSSRTLGGVDRTPRGAGQTDALLRGRMARDLLPQPPARPGRRNGLPQGHRRYRHVVSGMDRQSLRGAGLRAASATEAHWRALRRWISRTTTRIPREGDTSGARAEIHAFPAALTWYRPLKWHSVTPAHLSAVSPEVLLRADRRQRRSFGSKRERRERRRRAWRRNGRAARPGTRSRIPRSCPENRRGW